MKGLDIAEIRLATLEPDFRIDPEFFQQAHLAVAETLSKIGSARLGDLCHLFDGPFGSELLAQDYAEEGVPLLRMQNVTSDGAPNLTDVEMISEDVAARMTKYQVRPGELVVTKIGFLGHATVLPNDFPLYIFRRELTKCVPKQKSSVNSFALAAFFNGRFGRSQFYRFASGTTRDRVLLINQRRVLVPRFSKELGLAVELSLVRSDDSRKEADCLLGVAEQTLLEELSLADWQPPEPLTYTRRAAEAFAAGRLDAEFFHPKFEDLVKHIAVQENSVQLGDVLSFCERGSQPNYADHGLPVINSKHVRQGIVLLDEDNRYAIPDDDKMKIVSGDVLMNGTGIGTIGRAAPYLHSISALPDNHVTILRVQPKVKLDPVFLAIQLSSAIGQLQVEQYFKGSSGQIELYPQDIKKFMIWLAPSQIQRAVRERVEAAHAARRLARTLLDTAKRAVEISIEESEAAALSYLKEN